MVRGETQYNRLSRFVQEIPSEMLDRNKPLTAASFLYDGGESIDDDFEYTGDDDFSGGGYSGIKPSFAKGLAKSASKSSFDNGKSELANTYKLKAKPKPKVTKPRAVPDKPYIAGAGATHTKGQLAGISKGMPMKAETPDYVVGDRVSHVKYGEGTVTGLEQGPRDYKVTVMFDGPGQKVMYAAFAKLKKI
jgi:DNA helicase-2/ATP-dependent DNA helicase PcrA